MMTPTEKTLAIAIAALAVMTTRFVPFLFFGRCRELPRFVRYLGRVLAPAVFGLLCVYCYRTTPITLEPRVLAAFAAGAVTVLVQYFSRQMMLSMALGTGLYVILLKLV